MKGDLLHEKISWIKLKEFYNVSLLGPDSLMGGFGSAIFFKNLLTGKEIFYQADHHDVGDGVACVAGHKTLPVFAFSELCTEPRIFIKLYPSFEDINVLQSTDVCHYIELEFSETEYLVALTGMPDFKLEIWSWHSGQLLAATKTGIPIYQQYIKCSPGMPFSVCQLARKNGLLTVWDVHISIDAAKLIERKIPLTDTIKEGPYFATFYIDGNLLVSNKNGYVYYITSSTGSIKCIEKPSEKSYGDGPTLLTIFQCGIVVATSEGFVKYLKKTGNSLTEIWKTKVPQKLLFLDSSELLIAASSYTGIFQLIVKNDDVIVETIRPPKSHIQLMCILNPVGKYLITVNDDDNIYVLNISTMEEESSYEIHDIKALGNHPSLPIVAVGNNLGIVFLLSIYDSKNIIILSRFHICKNEITMIVFSQTGLNMIVVDETNEIFVINGKIGNMEIKHNIKLESNLIKIFGIDQENDHILIGLIKSRDQEIAGDRLVHICIEPNKKAVVKFINLPEPCVSICLNKESYLYLAPFMSYQMILVSFDNQLNLKIIDTITTPHLFKLFKLDCTDDYVITWGIDGIVTTMRIATKQFDSVILLYHRQMNGISKVVFDNYLTHLITFSTVENVICLKLQQKINYDHQISLTEENIAKPEYVEMLTVPTEGFNGTGEYENMSWLEIKNQKEFELTSKLYADKRQNVVRIVEDLRKKIKTMLNENEMANDEEKLPIQSFELHIANSKAINETAHQDRLMEANYLQNVIIAQNNISDWIKKHSWDVMEVKGAKLRGIFSKLAVENYPLLYKDPIYEKKYKEMLLWLKIEELASTQDSFQPWKPDTISDLEIMLAREPKIFEESNKMFGSAVTVVAVSHGKSNALSGTSTHEYLQDIEERYNQMEVVTFEQMYIEKFLGYAAILKLREFFNTKFNELQSIKENEMSIVLERNNRLRKIQSELNILAELQGSDERCNDLIIDPIYNPDEKPETIITIQDSEVPIMPYISPSLQKLYDEEAAENEKRRLEFLADDFRERALMRMMDGVLEIRWEDEIKKTPPVPNAMQVQKDIKDYDEQDLKDIREYEEKLRLLSLERERYRVMLIAEQEKLQNVLHEQISKFNEKVSDLYNEKINIEMAINQEEMRILRNSMYNQQRLISTYKERDLRQEITSVKMQISHLTTTLHELEKKASDCKILYDSLENKDRLLDKQFKNNFAEFASHTIIDQAYKLFKRRPKWTMRAWATSTILLDLAKRVVTKNQSKSGPPIPQDCFEYLQMLENIDQSSNCPSMMDDKLWELLCKMRRIKIESEFKVKSCGAQMAEADSAVEVFTKEIATKKIQLASLDKQWEELFEARHKHALNRTVQLVLKRGIVEIPLSGKISDFEDSILIHVSDVEDINKIARKAGQKKLKAMNNAAIFRRKIINKEWEHKVLKMTVTDLKEFVKVIEKCKITKEVQAWMKRKQMGTEKNLTKSSMEQEIEGKILTCENFLKGIVNQITDLDEKIDLKTRENTILDKKIQALNINVSEQHLKRDLTNEERQQEEQREKINVITERARLVRKVQRQHAQILELSTLLELQRLRTYPTLNLSHSAGYLRNQ